MTIRAPAEGASLVIGQSFRLVADSDLEHPPDQTTVFEIELTDRASGYRTAWRHEEQFGSEPQILDESFLVPPDAPAGDDYLLTVSVVVGDPVSGNQPLLFSDSIEVRVTASP